MPADSDEAGLAAASWEAAIERSRPRTDCESILRMSAEAAQGSHPAPPMPGSVPWLWRTGAFAGEFGDAFIKNTNLEGGDVPTSIELLHSIMQPLIDDDVLTATHLSLFDADDVHKVRRILSVLQDAVQWGRELFEMRSQLPKFAAFLSKWMDAVRNLPVGESLVINGGWLIATWRLSRGHATMYVIERDAEDTFGFTVVNTGEGSDYHPLYRGDYPKEKRRAAIRIGNISKESILEEGFWYLLFKMRFQSSSVHGPEQLYEVLLPFLASSSTEEDCTIATNVDAEIRKGNSGDFETMQRSGTCFFRVILSTLKYCLKRCGLSREKRKQLMYAVRVAFLQRTFYDLKQLKMLLGTESSSDESAVLTKSSKVPGLVGGWQSSDVRMVEMACNSTSMAAVKEVERGSLTVEGMYRIRSLTNSIRALLTWLGEGAGAGNSTPASQGQALEADASFCAVVTPFPGFEAVSSTIPAPDLDQLAGKEQEPPESQFVDLAPTDAVHTLAAVASLLVKTAAQCGALYTHSLTSSVSIPMHQICSLIEDVVTSQLPLPQMNLGIWSSSGPPVLPAALQLEALTALHTLGAQYTAASHSFLEQPRELASRRAVVLHTLLMLFDALLRVPVIGDTSRLAGLLLSKEGSPRPYRFSTNSFKEGMSLETLYADMIICHPAFLAAGAAVLRYFKGADAGVNPALLFDWRADSGRSMTQFRVEPTDNSMELVKHLLCGDTSRPVLPAADPEGSSQAEAPDSKAVHSIEPPARDRSSGVTLPSASLPSSSALPAGGVPAASCVPPAPPGAPPAPPGAPPAPPGVPPAPPGAPPAPPGAPPAPPGAPPAPLFLTSPRSTTRKKSGPTLQAILSGGRPSLRRVETGSGEKAPMGLMAAIRANRGKTRRRQPRRNVAASAAALETERVAKKQREEQQKLLVSMCGSLADWAVLSVPEFALARDLTFWAKLSLESAAQLYGRNPFFETLANEPCDRFVPEWWCPSNTDGTCKFGVRILGEKKFFLASQPPLSPIDVTRFVTPGQTTAPKRPHALAMLIKGKKPVILDTEREQMVSVAVATEQDVQNIEDGIPTFGGCLTEPDAVQLLSFLTVPFMSIPLVLAFFANNLIGALQNHQLRDLLESVLFEPRAFGLSPAVVTEVPTRNNKRAQHFVTEFGVLELELRTAPDATLAPLMQLLEDALRLTKQGNLAFVDLLLYLVRLCSRVLLIRSWSQRLHEDAASSSLFSTLIDVLGTQGLATLDQLAVTALGEGATSEGVRIRSTLSALLDCLLTVGFGDADPLVSRLVCQTSFVVSWHSKAVDDMRVKLASLAAAKAEMAAAEARRPARQINKGPSPDLLVINLAFPETPLADVFMAVQRQRRRVLQWTRAIPSDRLTAILLEVASLALQWAPEGGANSTWVPAADGVYACQSEGVEVNLQTSVVHFRCRSVVPTPPEILQHADYREIMPTGTQPYCTISSVHEHRQQIQVFSEGVMYHLDAWDGAHSADHCAGAFTLPTAEGGVTHLGASFAEYVPKSGDSLSLLFDPMFREAMEATSFKDSQVSVYRRTAQAVSAEPAMLMVVNLRQPTTKATWFEIFHDELLSCFSVFQLVEVGRCVRRSLVFTSHSDCALAFFPTSSADRKFARYPGTERAAGRLFGTVAGSDVVSAGTEDKVAPMIRSVIARRKLQLDLNDVLAQQLERVRQDCSVEFYTMEEFVNKRALLGLVPEPLLDTFHFWRISPREMVGYLRPEGGSIMREWWGDGSFLLVSTLASGAVIHRLSLSGQREPLLLLNPLGDSPSSVLGQLATIIAKLDSLSHVLVWSKSRAVTGEEAEISLIELPRLKLRFATKSMSGSTRLYSLDHSDLFVSSFSSADAGPLIKFTSCLQHGIVLENQQQQRFLLVPNFGLKRVVIQNCPFSASLVSDRSEEGWEAHVSSAYYLYPVHPSGNYLEMTSLSAALYMCLLRLLRRDYLEASLCLNSCSADDSFTAEELWILSHIKQTEADFHPDAHAVRLRLAIVCFEHARSAVDWDVEEDLFGYLQKYVHVSALARLTVEEERLLLEFLQQRKDTMYFTTLRLRYLNALKESQEAAADVLLQLPSQMRFGGSRIRALYVHANKFCKGKLKKSTGHIFYCYKRPTKEAPQILEGLPALELLQKIWEDNLYGQTHRTGFLLLYEMLMGRVHLRISPSPHPVELQRVPESSTSSRTLRNILQEEGPRYMSTTVPMVRLILHSLFFRYVTDRGLPPDTGLSLALLPIITSIMSGDCEQKGVGWQLPYLPYSRIRDKMEEYRPDAHPSLRRGFWGDHRSANHVVDDFEEAVTKVAVEFSESAEWKESPQFRYKKLEHRNYFCEHGDPSVVRVTPASTLDCRPVIENFSCGSRSFGPFDYSEIQDLPDSNESLSVLDVTPEDATHFASQPLGAIGLEQFVASVSAMDDSATTADEMVVIDQLASHPGAQTQFAAKTLERIRSDVAEAAAAARRAEVPRLLCLLRGTVEELSHSLGSDSLRTNSFVNRTSVTLKGILTCVEQVKAALMTLQQSDRRTVVGGVTGIELLANQFPVEPTATEVNGGEQPLVLKKLCFLFEREAHSKPWLTFHLLCQSLMTPDPLSELSRYNPFLGEARCQQMLTALTGLLFRSVRLNQINGCLVACSQLTAAIETLLRLELRRSVDLPWSPSAAMSSSVLAESHFDISEAGDHLVAMSDHMRELEDMVTAKSPRGEAAKAAFCVYHLYGFSMEASRDFVARSTREDLIDLVKLGERGCYFDGRPLTLPSDCDEDALPHDQSVTHATVHLLQHISEQLACSLSASRHYVAQADDGTFSFDPRFLVFEFVSDMLLRKRQVELVHEFLASVRAGNSSVQQMIMGAGKTTVICPLLSLLLADGGSLVTLVVPAALTEMSRSVLRTCFANIISKKVYTFSFDRLSMSMSSNRLATVRQLAVKLEVCSAQRGVVVTTPEAVKSLQLMYFDTLVDIRAHERDVLLPLLMQEVDEDDLRPVALALASSKLVAKELAKIIGLWGEGGNGVALLDEVDVLLHPLHSELNFPIGAKEPLPGSPFRWHLPFHIAEAVLFTSSKERAPKSHCTDADDVLCKIHAAVELGVSQHCLQKSPHLVLVREAFYRENLLPLVAEWVVLWLEAQPSVQADVVRVDAELSRASLIGYLCRTCGTAESVAMEETAMGLFSSGSMQLLNLATDWVQSFLPHCLSKVDRVHYGLLQARDLARLQTVSNSGCADLCDQLMPEGAVTAGSKAGHARRLLAVPFVGKDVPSQCSEFAHPDVVIGLTVLGYRYEGLRTDDVKVLLRYLKCQLSGEAGPYDKRPSNILFASWYKDAHAEAAHVPLEVMLCTDLGQVAAMREALGSSGQVIDYYLNEIVFPWTMHHQLLKLKASGEDLGSDMIFQRRLGFSGTPSDVLPAQLRPCRYEVGSEAKVLRTLLDPDTVSVELLGSWSVDSVLSLVVGAGGGQAAYQALIDPGALITGMSNEQVARALLASGLPGVDGVVFLDDLDRKMVVDRAGGPPLPLSRSGIPANKRFTFYDQVHTTGMDIHQPIDAQAAVLLGKDMTFRDYAQACWRMRGLGRGQSVRVIVVQEVAALIRSVCDTGNLLVDIATWLLLNSMQSEHLQLLQLFQQDISHAWRKSAMEKLVDASVAECSAIEAAEVSRLEAAKLAAEAGEDGPDGSPAAAPRTKGVLSVTSQSGNVVHVPSSLFFDLTVVVADREERKREGTLPSLQDQAECAAPPEVPPAPQSCTASSGWLDVFLEQLDYQITDSVPSVASLSCRMEEQVAEHQELVDQAAPLWLSASLAELKQVEEESICIQEGGRKDYDAEIVQEQEQQQQQQAQVASADDVEYGMEKDHIVHWRVSELLGDPQAGAVGRVFVPLRKLSLCSMHLPAQKRALQFREELLVSVNHSSMSHRSVLQRRLKPTYVCMAWLPVGGERRTVILSLAEAEAVRLRLLTSGEKSKYPVAFFSAALSPGRWLLPPPAALVAEESNEAHQIHLQCTRFFNGDSQFSFEEVISVLRGLTGTGLAARKEFFRLVLLCHKKEATAMSGSSVSRIFLHADVAELEQVQRVRNALLVALRRHFSSFLQAFQSLDTDHDGMLSMEELEAARHSLGVSGVVSPADMAVAAAYVQLAAAQAPCCGVPGMTLQAFLRFFQQA